MSSEERLKVLHLDHVNTVGGAELALARMLAESPPWAATVAIPRAGDRDDRVFESRLADDVSLQRIGPPQPAGASKGGFLQMAGFGMRILAQAVAVRSSSAFRSADVVHANSTRSAIYGSLAALGTRKTFVVHLRDMIETGSIGRAGYLGFTKIALRRADGLIANSAATLKSVSTSARGDKPVDVIPSAAGLLIQRRVRASPSVRKIGMVARIDPWKGQDLLIRAFARSVLPDGSSLVFAGGSPFGTETYLSELESLASTLGVGDRVEFRGHVSDVNTFIDEMDICVQASTREEPLGQNVLQYLARGVPTIVTDQGGPAEWVEHDINGLQFTIGSETALADALTRLASNHDLRLRLAAAAAATPGLQDDAAIASLHGRFFARTLAVRNGASS